MAADCVHLHNRQNSERGSVKGYLVQNRKLWSSLFFL